MVLWDVAARKRLVDEPLSVREGIVESVAFSPDGKTIAAGYTGSSGGGGGVVLWDAAARKRLVDEPLPVKEGNVRSVAFSPDGKTIAAGFHRQRWRWRGAVGRGRTQAPGRRATRRERGQGLERGLQPRRQDRRGRRRHRRRRRRGAVGRSRAQTPSRRAISRERGHGSERGLQPGRQDHCGGIRACLLGGVVLWDVAARKRLVDEPLPVKEGDVTSVAFSPDGKTIAAGCGVTSSGGVGGVVLWDVATRKRLIDEPLPVKEGRFSSVAFSPDGKTIAAGYSIAGGMGGVLMWDVAARKRHGRRATSRERWHRSERGLQPRRQDHRGRILQRQRGRRRRLVVGRRSRILAAPPAKSPIATSPGRNGVSISLKRLTTRLSPTSPFHRR